MVRTYFGIFHQIQIHRMKPPIMNQYRKLLAKFRQLYDAGVRKFDILNDDFGQGTHEDVVNLLNKLTKEFIIPSNTSRSLTGMQGYNNMVKKRLN